MARNEEFTVVRELYPEIKGRFWKKRKCPSVDFGSETAWEMTSGGGLTQLADAAACDAAVEAGHRVFAVTRRKLPFSRTVSNACREGEWTWNFVMSGEFTITDQPKFLRRWAADEGACGVSGLQSGFVTNGLWSDLEIAARQQIQTVHRSGSGLYSVAEIRELAVIPDTSWRSIFEPMPAASRGGCVVDVTYARFVSPDRECERRRIEAVEAQHRLEEQERLAYAAAVNEKTQEAELEAIEQQRQLVRMEFEAKQAEWEAEIQRQKVDVEIYEKQKLNEAEIALIRAKNEEEIRKAEALRAGDEAKASEAAEKIGAMTSALDEVLARMAKAAENLSALNVSAERLASWRPPSSISVEAARQYDAGVDKFSSLLGGISERAQDALVLTWEVARKADGFGTRDLMPARRRDEVSAPRRGTLRIGDRMTLRLKSSKSGYLTLFNLGTSGTVSKIFPHSDFGETENFIEAGRTYSLPGELMDGLPDGVWDESGPSSDETGRPERILAILTEESVVLNETCLRQRSCAEAMTRGGFAVVEEAVSELGDLEEGSWCFGLMEAWVR